MPKQYDSDGIFLCQKFCLRVTIKAQWRFLQPGGLESNRSDAPCSGHGSETEASAPATGRWSVELWHTQGNKGKTWENMGKPRFPSGANGWIWEGLHGYSITLGVGWILGPQKIESLFEIVGGWTLCYIFLGPVIMNRNDREPQFLDKNKGRKATEAPGREREQKLHSAKVRDQMFLQRWP